MVELAVENEDPVVFVATGSVTAREMLVAYAELLETATATASVLWDLSSATLVGLERVDLMDLAARVTQLGAGRRTGGKAAVVCSRDVDFGLARMAETFLEGEHYPVQVAVFRDVKEAKAWLSAD